MSSAFRRWSAEYKVVVLPEPVGPVIRIMPWLAADNATSRSMMSGRKPSASSGTSAERLSRMRRTTFSPKAVGIVETRRPISSKPTFSFARPSCGRLRSETSRSAMILMRETSGPSPMDFGTFMMMRSKPSTR